MADMNLRSDIVVEVRQCFMKQYGRLEVAAVSSVFQSLLAECERPKAEALKMVGANHIPDLIGTNLEHALSAYEWSGYAVVGDPTGIWVHSVQPLSANGTPPQGFRWAADGRFLLADQGGATSGLSPASRP
jgi:hypothetical protein